MKAIVLVGGGGTRLRPLTYDIPKPILPLLNQPYLVHQIAYLKSYGVHHVILSAHYLSEQIERCLGNGEALGVKIDYAIESSPLGTAGAARLASEWVSGEERVLVFNGDLLTRVDLAKLIDFHQQHQADVTLALKEVKDPRAYGLVLTTPQGRITQFLEKPENPEMLPGISHYYINAGIYVVHPKIFSQVPPDRPYSFEKELYPDLIAKGYRLFGHDVGAVYWRDIGRPEHYFQAQIDMLNGLVEIEMEAKEVSRHAWLEKSARLGAEVKLGELIFVGAGTSVGDYSQLEGEVIVGREVQIGKHVHLRQAVIWEQTQIGSQVVLEGCMIGRNCVIEDEVVVGPGVIVPSGSILKKGALLRGV